MREDEAILSWKLQLKKDLERISMPMRQVNFEGILLGFGWKKNGYDMGKIPGGETVKCSGCVS